VGNLSRYRWFGASVVLAGGAVATLAFAPHLAVAVAVATLVGAGAGMAFLSGTTLLGTEVEDAVRGRMFAFVQTAARVALVLAIAVASLLAGIGGVRTFTAGAFTVHVSASRGLLFVSGLLAVHVGVTAFRLMDDKPGTAVLPDLLAAMMRHDAPPRQARSGVLVALVGKADDVYATEIRALLRAEGHGCDLLDADAAAREQDLPVVGEPFLGPRAATLIRLAAVARSHALPPVLARGSVAVIHGTGFPVPASGTGHDQAATFEFSRLLRWATNGRTADVLVVVDRDPRPGHPATWSLLAAGRRLPRVVTVGDDPEAAARTVLAVVSRLFAGTARGRAG
jgi:dTMP kinase